MVAGRVLPPLQAGAYKPGLRSRIPRNYSGSGEVAMTNKRRSPETAAVHGISEPGKKNGPVATPIYQTSTFQVTDNDEQERVTTTDRYYTRWGNPTITVAEQTIAAIE